MYDEKYEMHAWWGSRPIGIEQCAASFCDFVNALPDIDPIYCSWLRDWPSVKPFCSVPLSTAEAVPLVEKRRARYDATGELWPELGYSLSARNAGPKELAGRPNDNAGTGVSVGSFNSSNPHCNQIGMRLANARLATGAPWRAFELRPLMKLVLRIWEPREISVDCARYSKFRPKIPDASFAVKERLLLPWVGWLTYLPADLVSKVTLPADLDVERLDDGSVIVSLCEEPFTIDNPVHMARARALEAAIRPIQT